mgnify:CR=1 FL=1
MKLAETIIRYKISKLLPPFYSLEIKYKGSSITRNGLAITDLKITSLDEQKKPYISAELPKCQLVVENFKINKKMCFGLYITRPVLNIMHQEIIHSPLADGAFFKTKAKNDFLNMVIEDGCIACNNKKCVFNYSSHSYGEKVQCNFKTEEKGPKQHISSTKTETGNHFEILLDKLDLDHMQTIFGSAFKAFFETISFKKGVLHGQCSFDLDSIGKIKKVSYNVDLAQFHFKSDLHNIDARGELVTLIQSCNDDNSATTHTLLKQFKDIFPFIKGYAKAVGLEFSYFDSRINKEMRFAGCKGTLFMENTAFPKLNLQGTILGDNLDHPFIIAANKNSINTFKQINDQAIDKPDRVELNINSINSNGISFDLKNAPSQLYETAKHFIDNGQFDLGKIKLSTGLINIAGVIKAEGSYGNIFSIKEVKAKDVTGFTQYKENILSFNANKIHLKGHFDPHTNTISNSKYMKIQVDGGGIKMGKEPIINTLNCKFVVNKDFFESSACSFKWRDTLFFVSASGPLEDSKIKLQMNNCHSQLLKFIAKDQYISEDNYKSILMTLGFTRAHSMLNIEGDVVIAHKNNCSDRIEFGAALNIEALIAKNLSNIIHLGWFKGEKVSHNAINTPLALLDQDYKIEGSTDVKGSFNGQIVEFTIDPTNLKYKSKYIDVASNPNNSEKPPNCIFNYDFCNNHWSGSIPLKNMVLNEHNFGLEFDSFSANVELKDRSLLFKEVQAKSEGVQFRAEITLDMQPSSEGDLKIYSRSIEGDIENALNFLHHFEECECIQLPIKGKIKSGFDEMFLHVRIGEDKALKDWRINADIFDVENTSKGPLHFQNIEGHLTYEFKNAFFKLDKLQGPLTVKSTKLVKQYLINIPSLYFDIQRQRLDYDVRVETPIQDILRLKGSGIHKSGEIVVDVDESCSHIFGQLLEINEWSFLDNQLETLRLNIGVKAKSLFNHIELCSIGLLEKPPEAFLNSIENDDIEGVIEIHCHYGRSANDFSFKLSSSSLNFGTIKLSDIGCFIKQQSDDSLMCALTTNIGSAKGIIKEHDKGWAIASIEMEYHNCIFKGSNGFYNTDTCALEMPVDKLGVSIDEIFKATDPYKYANSAISGYIEGFGTLKVDTSRGVMQSFLESKLYLSALDFGMVNLTLNCKDALSVTYHPQFGMQIENIDLNISHNKSEALWANCRIGSLMYDKKNIKGQGVQLTIPPEMVLFVLRNYQTPIFKVEEEYLLVSNFPIKWENQIETSLNFSFGEINEVNGYLQKGYYWINDISWEMAHLGYKYSKNSIQMEFEPVINKVPLCCKVDLPLKDMSSFALEIFERQNKDLDHKTLKALAIWDDQEGFVVQSLEGSSCGIEGALYRNAKQSQEKTLFLKGQLKLNIPKLERFLPENIATYVANLKIGKGFELSGDLSIPKKEPYETRFKGFFKGKNTKVYGAAIETILGEVCVDPNNILLSNLNISDKAGLAFLEKIKLEKNISGSWNISIPMVKITDFRPSLLRKVNSRMEDPKPFTIRNLVCEDFKGVLGDSHTFEGKGFLEFTNTFKTDYSVLDIPIEILGRLGLDIGLMEPIIGKISFQINDKKITLNHLENCYSQGKRSNFYLSRKKPSSIDFDGNMDINIKMKQYVLLKVTEPFILNIGGTIAYPKYSLK